MIIAAFSTAYNLQVNSRVRCTCCR